MENILIIEDDKSVRNSLVDLLRCSGYNTDSAVNGREALEIINESQPDLIISDIMMPEINGVDLLKKLRSQSNTASLPVIFLTAKAEYSDIRAGMNIGADDYILKPFKANEILQAVETRLNKKNMQIENFSYIKNNITHRIPNLISIPLLNISGFANILHDDANMLKPDEIRNYANRINRSQKNLSRLINKYISYADSTFLLINHTAYKYLRDSKLSLIKNITYQIIFENNIIRDRKNHLHLNLEDSQLQISPYHYQFIINELLENAISHSDSESDIYFTGYTHKNKYFLTVASKGKYFDKFTKENILSHNPLNNSVFEQNFPKLGLVTIKNIMEFYKGRLDIESGKAGITEIILRFPLS
ncbi:MAG: response regulator [Rhodothermaceae bacterium]